MKKKIKKIFGMSLLAIWEIVLMVLAFFLSIGFFMFFIHMVKTNEGIVTKNQDDLSILTLFTLPLIAGSLLQINLNKGEPTQNPHLKSSRFLILSSTFLIIGYLGFRLQTLFPDSNLNLFGSIGIPFLFLGSFLFCYALLKIGLYTLYELTFKDKH